jgi:acetyl esterase/lipase
MNRASNRTRKQAPVRQHVQHARHARHFRKWRVVWVIFAAIAALLGLALLAFITIKPFREEVDDWYYEAYAAYSINPTLDNISTKHKNVAYCGTSSRYQKFDVYTPKWTDKVPAVVYIHGGGWSVGDKANNNITVYGASIVRSGMAVVSLNYRLAPTYKYPIQNRDVACALNYLHAHAADFGIDPGRIGLWGDSAGGQLAAMEALDPQSKQARSVKAVVEFYGTADIWAQISHKVNGVAKPDKRAVAYIGSTKNKVVADKASPINANLSGAPPFLLFHGTNDQVVPYAQSVEFVKRLQAAGVDAELRPVQHANHNFSSLSQPSASVIKTEMVQFFKSKL